MRSSAIIASLGLALAAGSGAFANDQIYKCLDPNGVTVLSDKPCAVVEGVPADAAPAADVTSLPENVTVAPAAMSATAEAPRMLVVKEHYALPPAEVDNGQWARKAPATSAPKIDIATLKAAKLRLELSDRTASLD